MERFKFLLKDLINLIHQILTESLQVLLTPGWAEENILTMLVRWSLLSRHSSSSRVSLDEKVCVNYESGSKFNLFNKKL